MKQIATEMIQYQNDDRFPSDLTKLIDAIYQEIDDNVYKDHTALTKGSKHIKAIEKLIKHRFNLNIVFDPELHEYVDAAIIPFQSDYLLEVSQVDKINPSVLGGLFGGADIFKHIRQIEKERSDYLKKIHNQRGSINLKYARVSGYLADVKHYLIINFAKLKSIDITSEELMAIILHEIGHAFTGLENHHRLITTNTTIADILDELNKNNPEKANYIFKKHFDADDIEDAALGNKKEITDFYWLVAQRYVDELNTQMLNSKYDETSFENMADSFATRFNVGTHLVSALDKIYTRYGVTMHRSRPVFISLYLIEITFHLFILATSGPIAAAVIATVLLWLYSVEDNKLHMTYDKPLDRYNRIRNSIVNNLKNRHLPKKVVEDLLTQFKFIEEVIARSAEHEGVLHMISKVLFSETRENQYHIGLQQTLENGLNNILFVKSSELSVQP